MGIPLFSLVGVFIVGNPLLIHWLLAKRYILRLQYNVDSKVFTAHVMTFFGFEKTFTFTASDVHVPDVPGLLSMFKVKGQPMFANEADFTSIQVYKHMMGYDKPFDLKFGNKQKDK